MSIPLRDVSLPNSATRARSFFLAAPFFLFALQLPQASSELWEALLLPQRPQGFSWQSVLPFLTLFILSCLMNIISTSLTFASVQQIESGGRPSFGVAWRHVQAHAGSLAMASLLVGSLAGLGIFAAILPGLYFMAIYLFVPYLILVEPKAPLSVYFRKSKRLAKENFGKCLAFAMLGFLLSVADLVTADFGLSQSIGTSFGLGIRALIQMSTGLIMDLWVCSFFINLKRRSVEK